MGSYAFYLAIRFYMTDEFTKVPDDFFCTNRNWYDIKLLVDCYANSFTKEMSKDSYAKSMKKILAELSIVSNHIIHLGRVLGSAELELLENDRDGTLDMGNWAADVHKRAYSIKLPIKTMRRAAGFVLADGMHHNMRTTVLPDEGDKGILDEVFPFVKRCLAAVRERKLDDDSMDSTAQSYLNTALCFLEMLEHLALVFLQDAAAIIVLHPERKDMALYKHLPVLRGEAFARFVEKMRKALEVDEVPMDYKIEAVLPGVHDRLAASESRLGSIENRIESMENAITKKVMQEGSQTRDAIAACFTAAADSLRVGGSSVRVATQEEEEKTGGLLVDQAHEFYRKHKSIQSYFDEYYGLGDFKDKPIPGGLRKMEEKFGAKWRKHFKGGAKHMSRIKALMKAVADIAMELGNVPKAIDTVEIMFADKEKGKKRLSNLVDFLKAEGTLPSQQHHSRASSRGVGNG